LTRARCSLAQLFGNSEWFVGKDRGVLASGAGVGASAAALAALVALAFFAGLRAAWGAGVGATVRAASNFRTPDLAR
jgi:hypothetical protein